jgi:hypothetical protein
VSRYGDFPNRRIAVKIKHIVLTNLLFTLPIALSFAGQSSARINTPVHNQTETTKSELERIGYTCERVATNFITCTKNGSTTYWCTNNGKCVEAPRGTSSPIQLPTYETLPNNQLLHQNQ